MPKYVREVALLFGPDDDGRLLRLWGHDDLADGFAEESNIVAGDQGERLMDVWSGNQLRYPGRTLSDSETNEALEYIDHLRTRKERH